MLRTHCKHGHEYTPENTGAAWHEAEETLPAGASLVVRYQPWNGYTTVSAAPVERPEPPFVARASGPTPAAALRALAARLREERKTA